MALPKLNLPSSFSIALWLRTAGRGAEEFPWGVFVIDRDICNFFDDWSLSIDYAGRLQFHVGPMDWDVVTSTAAISDSAWHFVTITHDSATTTNAIYIDSNRPAARTFGPATFNNDTLPVLLGQANCKPEQHVNYAGLLDEVMVFDRALGAAEVEALLGRQ